MTIEAMKQALEALRCIESPLHVWEINKLAGAMNALRQAIAEAEKQTCQENRQVAPPPQREWVWLSDQDYEEIMKEKTYWYEVPKAVEIKSKEKNHG
jgi:hypothetical protein